MNKSEIPRVFFIKRLVFFFCYSAIQIRYLSKVFFLRVPKTNVVLTNGTCLTLCQ